MATVKAAAAAAAVAPNSRGKENDIVIRLLFDYGLQHRHEKICQVLARNGDHAGLKSSSSSGRQTSPARLWLSTAYDIVERNMVPMYFDAAEFVEHVQRHMWRSRKLDLKDDELEVFLHLVTGLKSHVILHSIRDDSPYAALAALNRAFPPEDSTDYVSSGNAGHELRTRQVAMRQVFLRILMRRVSDSSYSVDDEIKGLPDLAELMVQHYDSMTGHIGLPVLDKAASKIADLQKQARRQSLELLARHKEARKAENRAINAETRESRKADRPSAKPNTQASQASEQDQDEEEQSQKKQVPAASARVTDRKPKRKADDTDGEVSPPRRRRRGSQRAIEDSDTESNWEEENEAPSSARTTRSDPQSAVRSSTRSTRFRGEFLTQKASSDSDTDSSD